VNGWRRTALASFAGAGAIGTVVALVSCAGGERSALLSAAPLRPDMSIVALVRMTTTTVAPSTTTTTVPPTTATTTTVPPTTVPVTEPPTTVPPAPPVPHADPAPPLAAPLAPAGAGAAGDAVTALQQRLIDLGFWIDEADGQYGGMTTQAVMAFQKYYTELGLKATGRADQATVDALAAVTLKPFADVSDQPEAHVVVDKPRQVLHVVSEGRTMWTLNTSTGNGGDYTEVDQKRGGTIKGRAITPTGAFNVYREYTNGWERGELGQLYRPKYFAGGVAVHGSNNIPNYPASHGCVRITTTAMDWIWANDLMPRGTVVVVRGE
jgi:peptidoglycan hydrolase-like protein with peptidoglycan-binding domain